MITEDDELKVKAKMHVLEKIREVVSIEAWRIYAHARRIIEEDINGVVDKVKQGVEEGVEEGEEDDDEVVKEEGEVKQEVRVKTEPDSE